jgi:hypothetical protein
MSNFKKMIKLYFTFSIRISMVIFFVGGCVYAQSGAVNNILLKSFYYYKNTTNLTFDMHYSMYDAHQSNNIIQEMDGYYQLMEDNLVMRMGSQLQLHNRSYSLIVDEGSKTMLVQAAAPRAENSTPLGVDSLVKMFENITVTKEENGSVYLHFDQPRASFFAIKTFDLVIEKSTGILQKAILYYAFDLSNFYEQYENNHTIPRIEISYLNYREGLNTSEIFDEKKYFTLNKNKIKPALNYAGYKVLDIRKDFDTNQSN